MYNGLANLAFIFSVFLREKKKEKMKVMPFEVSWLRGYTITIITAHAAGQQM